MRFLMKAGLFLLVLAAVLVGVSYNVLRAQDIGHPQDAGSRAIASEVRTVDAGVVVIKLSGPINLRLRQGTTPSMSVRAEQRLLSKIKTLQEGNTLYIDTKGIMINVRQPLHVELTLPALQQLQVMGSGDSQVTGFSGDSMQLNLVGSGEVVFNGQYKKITAILTGSGDLKLTGGNSEKVELESSGSGDIIARGATQILTAKLNGSGDLNARDLVADTVSVNLHGSGDVLVHAKNSISLASRGSGDIRIYGKPMQRNITTSGSGGVGWD